MGRREKPLDTDGPLAQFASGLRSLRALAGFSYQELSRRTMFVRSVLSEAAGGVKFPTWEVTAAYVQACGGDLVEWKQRWDVTREQRPPPVRADRPEPRTRPRPAPEPDPGVPATPRPTAGTGQLSARSRSKLAAAACPRHWDSGQVLFREADASDHVTLLLSGLVKIAVTASNGRQVLIAIRGPGDLIGEESAIDGEARPATVTALTPVRAAVLTGAEFHRFIRADGVVALELLKMSMARMRESTQRRLESGSYDVTARTARLLVDYARDYGEPSGAGITVRLRQAELAEAVAASRESVAKALRAFREAGAVRTLRASFEILEPALLDSFAEPDGTRP